MTEADPPPLQNAALCQIGFVARDGAATARKLARLTGLPLPDPIVTDGFDKARTEYRGQPTPATAKLYFFDFGQLAVEIIEPVGGPSTWREFLDRRGDGVHHIAFRVENTGRTAAALSALGMPSIQKGVFEGGSYDYIDAEKYIGTILELLDSTNSV
ncbi:MAG: VOC family protein [Anaerolineales bacterium]|nr:VOC family protein [Anaerolineales bacterium]